MVHATIPFTADPQWSKLTVNLAPISPMTMDINGDGRSDLLLAMEYPYEAGFNASGGLVFFEKVALIPALSLGDGTYNERSAFRTSVDQPLGSGFRYCRPGDLNGDGRADLACTFAQAEQPGGTIGSFLMTAISHGDGSFTTSDAQLPFAGGRFIRSMAVGDQNEDGRSDVMFLDYRAADIEQILMGQSVPLHYDLVTGHSITGDASSFAYTRQETDWVSTSSPLGPPRLAAADINGDGRADYLAFQPGADGKNPVAILTARTQPDGPFALLRQPVPDELSAVETIITVGDADGDGRDDLLVASRHEPGSGTGCTGQAAFPDAVLTRVLSAPDGTFRLPATWDDCRTSQQVGLRWNQDLRSQELDAADTNGDGFADFLVAFNADNVDSVILRDDVSPSTGLDTYRWCRPMSPVMAATTLSTSGLTDRVSRSLPWCSNPAAS